MAHIKKNLSTRNTVFLIFLLNVMSSCDYSGNYYYFVENKLQKDTIHIKTQIAEYGLPAKVTDTTFVVLPNETKLITVEATGPLGKHEHPSDKLAYYCTFGKFEIIVNNTKFDKNLREKNYWQYTTEPLKGMYVLVIDSLLIKSIKSGNSGLRR